jgi:serine/threonine-protein kinase
VESITTRLSRALSGRYEIIGPIGRGGMASVFLAHDRNVDRRVAMKVLTPELHHGVNPDRFVAEIRTAANLQHPHILPLFDSGEAGGLLYYTMPYVEGSTLKERVSAGPLELEEALEILREVGKGLHHAHEQGLIHRDVKPGNVLLSSGQALLADFGLARAVEVGASSLTQTGAFVGSSAYTSPEQVLGDEGIDRRSDLYSLGCVAYELLTGRPPYEASTLMAMIAAHATREVPHVSDEDPSIPRHVSEAIARAMSKEREDRQPTVAAFLDELSGSSPVVHPRAEGDRLVWLRLLAGAVGVAAIVGVGGWLVSWSGGGGAVSELNAETALVPSRVVVAPFSNRTPDSDLDQLGRLAADMITEGLHRTGVVDVVPGLMASRAAEVLESAASEGGVDPILAIAEETSAGKVVSGAYYLDGEDVVIQAQITDANTGLLLEALESVRGPRSAPARAVDELRERVMGALSVHLDQRLGPAWVEQIPSPTFDAYRTFDRGMQEYTGSNWQGATELFLSAYEADTTFVLPLQYAALSAANMAGGYPIVDSVSGILDTRRDELAEYHQHWLDWVIARKAGRNEQGRISIRQAASLAPTSKAVYNSAYAAQLTNRPAEAVEALQSLPPERGPMRGWFPYWDLLTDNLHRVGRHEEELEAAQQALEHYPERLWSRVYLGEALVGLGRVEEALELLPELEGIRAQDADPNFGMYRIARELLHHGYPEEARQALEMAAAWYEGLPTSERDSVPGYLQDRARDRVQEVHVGVLTHLGRLEEARSLQLELVEELPDDPFQRANLGVLEALLGNRGRAERMIEELEEIERSDPYSRGVYSQAAALIAGALGDADRAGGLLQRSFREGERPLRHPGILLEPLMDHPEVRDYFTPRN